MEAALAELVRMDKEDGLLARDIMAIDMRLEDRITVRLSEEAAEQRKIMTGGRGRSGNGGRDT